MYDPVFYCHIAYKALFQKHSKLKTELTLNLRWPIFQLFCVERILLLELLLIVWNITHLMIKGKCHFEHNVFFVVL